MVLSHDPAGNSKSSAWSAISPQPRLPWTGQVDSMKQGLWDDNTMCLVPILNVFGGVVLLQLNELITGYKITYLPVCE